MMEFGKRLREARIETGLTQKQAAARVGMSQSTLSGLETGEQPTSTFLPQLAALYGVNVGWLTGDTGQKKGSAVGLSLPPDIDALLNHYSKASEAQRELVKIILRNPKGTTPPWAVSFVPIIDGIVEAAEKACPSKTAARKTA